MRRIHSPALALVGLIVLLGMTSAACSKNNTPSTSGSSSQAPATGGVTLEQGPGDALVFSPTELTVKQGDTITVKNVSSMPHTFTITGKGIDVVDQPGQTTDVTIDLPPGTYEFICRFHVSSGMKGTLIVQ
jgi:plastocyanin